MDEQTIGLCVIRVPPNGFTEPRENNETDSTITENPDPWIMQRNCFREFYARRWQVSTKTKDASTTTRKKSDEIPKGTRIPRRGYLTLSIVPSNSARSEGGSNLVGLVSTFQLESSRLRSGTPEIKNHQSQTRRESIMREKKRTGFKRPREDVHEDSSRLPNRADYGRRDDEEDETGGREISARTMHHPPTPYVPAPDSVRAWTSRHSSYGSRWSDARQTDAWIALTHARSR